MNHINMLKKSYTNEATSSTSFMFILYQSLSYLKMIFNKYLHFVYKHLLRNLFYF